LAIYGTFQKGNLNHEVIEGFRSIAFTVIHRQLKPEATPSIANHIAAALDARKFAIRDKNSFIDQDVVINNLSEVSRFFIGLALTLELKINEAREILEPLLHETELKANAKANNPKLEKFAHAIRCCLAVIYEASLANTYNARLIEHITDRSCDDAALECKRYLEQLKKINAVNSSYYLSEAILLFHFGDVDAAIKAIEHARRLAPFANSAHHFSFAFLHLWKGEYKKSFMQYVRAGKWANPDMIVIMNLLTFLATIRRLHPTRIEIIFSQAFINDRFLDQQVALEDYHAFLDVASATELPEFVGYATRRVLELESSLKAKDYNE
jgi:tetratricopeptide (TPR) repeat protein